MEENIDIEELNESESTRRHSVSSIGSCMRWLFDPTRVDHLPIEDQLKLYKSRDLAEVKSYKYATKIWGAPLSRKRVIIAPPMERSEKPPEPFHSAKVTADLDVKKTILDNIQPVPQEKGKSPGKENIDEYKKWITDRKKFRSDLDGMGLSIEYLSRKTDLSRVERSVLRKMRAEKNYEPPETPVSLFGRMFPFILALFMYIKR